jgi:hypothetical protein
MDDDMSTEFTAQPIIATRHSGANDDVRRQLRRALTDLGNQRAVLHADSLCHRRDRRPRCRRASWALPLAGALIGLLAAAAAACARRGSGAPRGGGRRSPPLVATGCLHEDGLADTADGFGGGATRERKLEIMRDSRIGSYGACALILSLLLRWSALASLGEPAVVGEF